MLEEITDFIKEDQTCLVLGDFNLDFAKNNCPEYRHLTIYDKWLEMALAFDLKQMVEEITWERLHVNELRSSILDHAYTNNIESMKEVVVEKQEVSDHSLLRIETERHLEARKYKTLKYQNWKKFRYLISILQQKKIDYNTHAPPNKFVVCWIKCLEKPWML